MEQNKEIRVNTIEDFFSIINQENVDMLTGNFYGMCMQLLKLKETNPDVVFKSFRWIDDGNYELRRPEVFEPEIIVDPETVYEHKICSLLREASQKLNVSELHSLSMSINNCFDELKDEKYDELKETDEEIIFRGIRESN